MVDLGPLNWILLASFHRTQHARFLPETLRVISVQTDVGGGGPTDSLYVLLDPVKTRTRARPTPHWRNLNTPSGAWQ